MPLTGILLLLNSKLRVVEDCHYYNALDINSSLFIFNFSLPLYCPSFSAINRLFTYP